MSKDRIKGFLIGDPIDITCTKNQGKLLRAKLADWFDEDVRTSEETSTVPFTEKDVKAYLDECIIFWRKERDNPLIKEYNDFSLFCEKYADRKGLGFINNFSSFKKEKQQKEQHRISMAEHYVDAFQSVRMSLFGELLPVEEKDEPKTTES